MSSSRAAEFFGNSRSLLTIYLQLKNDFCLSQTRLEPLLELNKRMAEEIEVESWEDLIKDEVGSPAMDLV